MNLKIKPIPGIVLWMGDQLDTFEEGLPAYKS